MMFLHDVSWPRRVRRGVGVSDDEPHLTIHVTVRGTGIYPNLPNPH